MLVLFIGTMMSCNNKHRVFIAHTGEQKIFNMPYGKHKRHIMDIFSPKEIDENKPTILIIHGGAWQFGRKEHIGQIQRYLLKEGFVSYSINYRLVSRKKGITYREQLDDVAHAVQQFKEFADKANIPYRGLVVLGESAGGHLALMYGYTHFDTVYKIIALSPPVDFYSEKYRASFYYKLSHRTFEKVVGVRYTESSLEEFQKASPIFVASAVPTLHFQGGRDILVHQSQGLTLDSVLTEKQIPHQLVFMPKRGHTPRLLSKKFRETVLYPHIKTFLQKTNECVLQIKK